MRICASNGVRKIILVLLRELPPATPYRSSNHFNGMWLILSLRYSIKFILLLKLILKNLKQSLNYGKKTSPDCAYNSSGCFGIGADDGYFGTTLIIKGNSIPSLVGTNAAYWNYIDVPSTASTSYAN